MLHPAVQQRQRGDQEDSGSGKGGDHQVRRRKRQLEGQPRSHAERGGDGGQQNGVRRDRSPLRTLLPPRPAMYGDRRQNNQRRDGRQDVSGKLGVREGEERNRNEGRHQEEYLKGKGWVRLPDRRRSADVAIPAAQLRT